MTRAGFFAANEWRWCVTVSAIALAFGIGRPAQAAYSYWNDEPSLYRPAPARYPHHQKMKHGQAEKSAKAERESGKPQGPLIIAISINEQKLRIYDANGFYAESPISTGMRGHATPMGVFSVIQKQKYHRSNIYSGAPMPYMQRITWSGVAMHAGVLPGYPASHGCIRMPMAFAVKMWNWTRMGARVVVTPGEMTPANFSHPLLPTIKVAPQPEVAAAPETNDPVGTKADKGAADPKPATTQASLELRTTIGHHDDATPVAEASPAPLRDQTHTADASGERGTNNVTMSDASTGVGAAQGEAKPGDTADAKYDEDRLVENVPAESKPSEAAAAGPAVTKT